MTKLLAMLVASVVLTGLVCVNVAQAEGDQDKNCWVTFSGRKQGGAKVIDGEKKGDNRLPDDFGDGDGRVPLWMARPSVVLLENPIYTARLVAPSYESGQSFREGGQLMVSFFNKGKPIGPYNMNKPITKAMQKELEAAGVEVEYRKVGKGKVDRLSLKFGKDRVSRDINLSDGSFGAVVLTDEDHPLTNGVCGGVKYVKTSKNQPKSIQPKSPAPAPKPAPKPKPAEKDTCMCECPCSAS